MAEQTITVNLHAYSGGGISVRHQGPCTWENCGRFLEQITGGQKPPPPRSVIDHAIDAVQGKNGRVIW